MSLRERAGQVFVSLRDRFRREGTPSEIKPDPPSKDPSPRGINRIGSSPRIPAEDGESGTIDGEKRRVLSPLAARNVRILKSWGAGRVEEALEKIPNDFDSISSQHLPAPVERVLVDILYCVSKARVEYTADDPMSNRSARRVLVMVQETFRRTPKLKNMSQLQKIFKVRADTLREKSL